jgi:hypothetical protein
MHTTFAAALEHLYAAIWGCHAQRSSYRLGSMANGGGLLARQINLGLVGVD